MAVRAVQMEALEAASVQAFAATEVAVELHPPTGGYHNQHNRGQTYHSHQMASSNELSPKDRVSDKPVVHSTRRKYQVMNNL